MRHWGEELRGTGRGSAPSSVRRVACPLCEAWRAHLGAVDSLHDDVGGVDQIDDVHHADDVLVVQLL